MSQQAQSLTPVETPFALTPSQREALHLARKARDAARGEGCDVWQFAVEIAELRAAGLSHTELRLLLCWGLLHHGRERTNSGAGQRTFRQLDNLALPRRTCFVLTVEGLAVASARDAKPAVDLLSAWDEGVLEDDPKEVPRWDSRLRQLWWRDRLIKHFRVPAANQEAVLDALEEEGWPMRIDDPLPHTTAIDPKARLRDTLKSLNNHQLHRLLYFRGDGNGLGVYWLGLE